MSVVLPFWFKNYTLESLAKISDFGFMENGLMRMKFYNSRAWLKSNIVSTGKNITSFTFKALQFVITD